MVSVQRFECGPVATNAYLVVNTAIHLAFVVDVPKDSASIIIDAAQAAGCKLTDIILTHSHWDHTADCSELVARTGARVSIHSQDAYRLLEPMRHTVWPLPFTIHAVVPDILLEHNTEITAAGVRLRVLHTPGHTEGGVCLVDALHERVFVGDTLFAGSVGRTDLPGGNMEVLMDSIHKHLLTLPDQYNVFPGHGLETTIAMERSTNPFLI
ncbi:MAG: MBL fold metallo-hydrolase [Bradyrhizobiaceae bacterium]|nr:MBL fold metallo-hydrolase [Bradyrhizobiaceae bacterium]